MQSHARVFGLALLLRCSLIFLFCSVMVGQADPTAFEPSLRGLNQPNAHRGSGPQYDIVELSARKLLQYYPELKGMVPASSQQELPKLLEKVGANEDQLLHIPSIAADENVVQEQLDKHGWVQGSPAFTGHYSYFVRAQLNGEGTRLKEGRADRNWQAIDPDVPTGYSLIKGFALLPLNFHPTHQGSTTFRYLGREVLDNREHYVVAFAQQPAKAELLGTVRVNGHEVTVAYQGIAWIDPDSFQIARLRLDLLKPPADVGTETIETQFGEVHLPVVDKSFWLPREAVVTRSAKGGSIREKHLFSDYKIFAQYKISPAPQAGAEKPK